MSHAEIPRTFMERLASLERRVAELERALRESRRVGVIPASVRVVNPTPDVPWGPVLTVGPRPGVVEKTTNSQTHLDEVRYGDKL